MLYFPNILNSLMSEIRFFEEPVNKILDGCNHIVWNSGLIDSGSRNHDRRISILDAITGIRTLVSYIEMQLSKENN